MALLFLIRYSYNFELFVKLFTKFSINFYDNSIKKWVIKKNYDLYIVENWGEVFNFEPIWNIQMQLNFDLSIFRPAKEKGLLTSFMPGPLALSIKQGMDIIWDNKVKKKATKMIVKDKRLFHFNPDYFDYDSDNNKWSTFKGRIQLKIEEADIQKDVIHKILSMAILLLYNVITVDDFREGLNHFKAKFDFDLLVCKDTYVLIKVTPVLSTKNGP